MADNREELKRKLLEKMRNKQKEMTGFQRDITEWRPPKMEKGKPDKEFRVVILPPLLSEDDSCVGGKPSKLMGYYCVPHGAHFINKKKYECPRVHEGREACPLCSFGFDLMKSTDNKDQRSAISKEWLSKQLYAVNVYFLNHKDNPDELRGKVLWWSLPQAIHQLCEQTLNSNDPGDDDDPKAHGMFFDEDGCHVLKVIVSLSANEMNEYKKSVFLGRKVKLADLVGGADKVPAVLSQRFDIYSKFDKIDVDQLNKVFEERASQSNGVDESNTPAREEVKAPPKIEAKTETKVEEAKADPPPPPPKVEVKAEVKASAQEAAKAEVKPDPPKEKPKIKPPTPEVQDPEIAKLLSELGN